MKIPVNIYILIIDFIIMNLGGNHLFMLPSIQNNSYRTYEKVSKKIINAKWSIEFNEILK